MAKFRGIHFLGKAWICHFWPFLIWRSDAAGCFYLVKLNLNSSITGISDACNNLVRILLFSWIFRNVVAKSFEKFKTGRDKEARLTSKGKYLYRSYILRRTPYILLSIL